MSYPGHQLRASRRTREIFVRNLEPPPISRSRSRSASPQPSIHNRLDQKDAETNLVNFVDFLSEEDVNVERDIPMDDAKLVGLGSTMEVYSATWKGQQVAVKRMRRDKMPVRSANLPYEHDTAFAKAAREFYGDVKSMMQEILVMSREPLSTHRNIVRLLAVSWDDDEGYWANHLFPPIMVVELANADTPTLDTFYMNRSGSRSFSTDIGFIADIADGLSALHMCGVIHGDLKPQNILLFDDLETKGGLIAKVADFGFANIEFLKESIRGESERWEAPERIHGCPEEIMTAMQELDLAGCASDVYSFGLVAIFIALDGVDSLATQGVRNGESAGIEETIREIKFTDQARSKIEVRLRAYYEELDWQESSGANELCERYVSLIHDTLQSIPPKRVSSLGGMRLRLTGRDQFARQRKLDRFKVRPFGDAFNSSSARRSIFTKPTTPFSYKVLDSLPDRVDTELRAMVGKRPELGESQLHKFRRIKLYDMGKNTKTKPIIEEATAIDYENVKLDAEVIGRMISSARDWFDMFATLGINLFTTPNAELEFLDLDSGIRPQLFTLIDANRLKEARELLRANPSLVEKVEPETGWYPIHLAACEGRTKFLRMFISEFGANPNIRSRYYRSTPLHQAVGGRKAEAVKILLDMGAHVDAKLSMSEERQQFTALELAMNQVGGMCPSQDYMEVIRVLLQGGADYLRNFNGYPIAYAACKHVDLLRLFFDCIGPEDSRLLVHYRDAQKETMLHTAVMFVRLDVVKLLLELGADPGARDINGQTAYVKLLTWTLSQNTAGLIPIQGLIGFFKTRFNLEDANKVLALLEEIGEDASALEDNSFSKEEVEQVHSNLKSSPRLGKVYNPIQIANAQFQVSRYFESDSPCITKLTSISGMNLLVTLAQNLATWAANRKEGLIPLDSLPEGWSELFEEANREMEGLLTSWMQEDQIPELTKLVKDTTISACEWVVNKNGSLIILLVNRIIHEFICTGAADDLEEHLTSVLTTAWKIYLGGLNVSWATKIFGLQRLKRIWRAINKGEILDLFYELAVLVNCDQTLDNLDDYTVFQPLRTRPQTPSWAFDKLSLAKRYPEATIFVTTQQSLPPHTRVALFFSQVAIFLFPFLLFTISIALEGRKLCYDSSFIVIATYLVGKLFPAGWIFIDRNYRPHPNILRGLQAAWELVMFRGWHWFWYPAQEPLILSIRSKPAKRVDIPSRLDSTHKTGLFPIYWLSLKPENVANPVPCYAAMGEVMTKWKNGGLPRNSWGDGWWELREDGGHAWKRVNVTEHPTWSDYSRASRQIKEHLLAKDHDDVYSQFLDIRDYFLKTPSEQLIAMNKLFGDEHYACLMIWQRLFVDEDEPKPKPYQRRDKLGWLERVVSELHLDRIRDMIVYTWDKGLLNEEGRPIGSLPLSEVWESVISGNCDP